MIFILAGKNSFGGQCCGWVEIKNQSEGGPSIQGMRERVRQSQGSMKIDPFPRAPGLQSWCLSLQVSPKTKPTTPSRFKPRS